VADDGEDCRNNSWQQDDNLQLLQDTWQWTEMRIKEESVIQIMLD
jgi:hypothetical protein